MKRINILQHVPYETPGCIEEWINKKSYECEITKIYEGGSLPSVSSIDWLVIMGGPMSVHDTDKFPWLVSEKKYIKEAIASNKVVVGICLGSQLIAEALGSRVYRNDLKEIGWFPVKKSGDKTESELLKSFNNTEIVFHWHGDTFEMPSGASREFLSDACRNQCFTYNKRVIALQFHVEVTEHLLKAMIQNGIDELIPGEYVQSAESLSNGTVHIKRNNDLMFSILDGLDNL